MIPCIRHAHYLNFRFWMQNKLLSCFKFSRSVANIQKKTTYDVGCIYIGLDLNDASNALERNILLYFAQDTIKQHFIVNDYDVIANYFFMIQLLTFYILREGKIKIKLLQFYGNSENCIYAQKTGNTQDRIQYLQTKAVIIHYSRVSDGKTYTAYEVCPK